MIEGTLNAEGLALILAWTLALTIINSLILVGFFLVRLVRWIWTVGR